MIIEKMDNPDYDICVVGAIGVDTNCYLYNHNIDFINEANFTENIDGVGQAGGYCARLSKALGNRTYFFGFIGDDWQGELIRQRFVEERIEHRFFLDKKGTKRSVNIVSKDGSRKNFYDGKDAMNITVNPVDFSDIFYKSQVIHINIVNWARQLLSLAKQSHGIISCDLQDMPSVDDSYRKEFLEQAHVIFFSGVNLQNPTLVLEELMNRYPEKKFFCTMGKDGCVFNDGSTIVKQDAVELDREIVDTNGAGDSFAMGTLTSLLRGFTLHEAVFRGQICARYTCTLRADTKGFLTSTDWEKYWKNNRKELI